MRNASAIGRHVECLDSMWSTMDRACSDFQREELTKGLLREWLTAAVKHSEDTLNEIKGCLKDLD